MARAVYVESSALAFWPVDELGVSRQTINSIEQGEYDPSLRVASGWLAPSTGHIEEVFSAQD